MHVRPAQSGFSLPIMNIVVAVCAVLIWFLGWQALWIVAAGAVVTAIAVWFDEDVWRSTDDDWPSEIEYQLSVSEHLDDVCRKLRHAFETEAFISAENKFNDYRIADAPQGWKVTLTREKDEIDSPLFVKFKNATTKLEQDHYERFGNGLANALGVEATIRYQQSHYKTSVFHPRQQ